jgi:hypothetical protein
MNGITPNGVSDNIPGRMWPDNGTVAAMQPGAFWAKITGNASGTNRYAWTQIDTGDTAAFDVGLSEEFAATGTSSADGAPAYEVNGRTDVATGTRVLLYPMGDLTYYGFAAPATSGGITVQDIDSSPSYTGITTLRFDQADGFTLSNPSAGVARVDFSGVTGSGSDNQITRWDGSTAIQGSNATLNDTGTITIAGDYKFTSPSSAVQPVFAGNNTSSYAPGLTFVGTNTVPMTASGLAWYGRPEADTQQVNITVTTDASEPTMLLSGVHAGIYVGDPDSLLKINFGTLQIISNGSYVDCATGTLGPGATFVKGYCTSVGSGSFVGTATSNAFTGTNSFSNTTTFTGSLLSQSAGTFTPASAATVPLTVKGAASQSSYLQRNEDSTGALLGGFDDDGVYRGPADFGEWTSPPPPPPPPPPPVSPPIPPPP